MLILQLERIQGTNGRNAFGKRPKGANGTSNQTIQQKNVCLYLPFTRMQMFAKVPQYQLHRRQLYTRSALRIHEIAIEFPIKMVMICIYDSEAKRSSKVGDSAVTWLEMGKSHCSKFCSV